MSLHSGAMMPDRTLNESALINAAAKVAADLARLRGQPDQRFYFYLQLIWRNKQCYWKPIKIKAY